MLLFSKYPGSKNRRSIFIGQFIGSYILILISLFFCSNFKLCTTKMVVRIIGLNSNWVWD
ncbi:cadmium resistance transporter [Paucilactobacillus hokkaidonensis]|uniref:cadmium resistance transporter n=1 Tax=Paucilactobacillus hokkaidonensis TaxID=1193095 RepID=UPI0020930267|nr:cadmium resistance transporter [Paucilactobacillus hokkaidonensis]